MKSLSSFVWHGSCFTKVCWSRIELSEANESCTDVRWMTSLAQSKFLNYEYSTTIYVESTIHIYELHVPFFIKANKTELLRSKQEDGPTPHFIFVIYTQLFMSLCVWNCSSSLTRLCITGNWLYMVFATCSNNPW